MTKQLNVGLKSLIDKSAIKGRISTYDLGFKLGPRINAAGRLGHSSFGTELLTATDSINADRIANELDKEITNGNIDNACYLLFGQIINKIHCKPIFANGLFWKEIDTLNDINYFENKYSEFFQNKNKSTVKL